MPERTSSADPSTSDAEQLAADLVVARTKLTESERELQALRQVLEAGTVRELHLQHELQHRVRNMLAVIRSIYRRSRECGASQDEFAEHFEGRLLAIGRYNVAATGLGAEVDLEDIVRDQLLDVQCADGPNLVIEGPPIRLEHKSAELMGLAVHELTTNAIKFGALYQKGKILIEWAVKDALLHFSWRESGVKVLAIAPRPNGFGRQLIEEALPYELGATTSFVLQSGGLHCTIVMPTSNEKRPPKKSADWHYE